MKNKIPYLFIGVIGLALFLYCQAGYPYIIIPIHLFISLLMMAH